MNSQSLFTFPELILGYHSVSDYWSNSTASWVVERDIDPIHKFTEFLVPPHQRRTQVTRDNVFEWLLLASPLLPLAYLVRRQHTCFIRRAIMPFATALMIRFVFAYRMFPRPETTWNYVQIICGFCLIARCIEFGWVSNGRRKLTEIAPGVPKDPLLAEIIKNEPLPQAVWRGTVDATEMLLNTRGIGYDFGSGFGLRLPPISKTENDRATWIRQTVWDIAGRILWIDLMHNIIKLQPWVPGVGSPTGGSLWNPKLSPIPRSVIATLLHVTVGEMVTNGFPIIYDTSALFAVTILRHDPSYWPPLFGNPWQSTSVSKYWAVYWHQMLRQTFFIFCGFPLQALLGQVGLLFGAFLASGLVHSWAMYGNGMPGNNEIVQFFVLQAFAIIAERAFRKMTGRSVGGFWGSLWVFAVIVLGGQRCSDAWAKGGVLGGQIIPDQLSIVRKHIIPKTMQFLEAIEVL